MNRAARRVSWLVLWATAIAGCDGAGRALRSDGMDVEEGHTVLLTTVSGANHIDRGRFIRKSLDGHGWKDVFILSKEGHTEVFWGKYRKVASARKNLKVAQDYRNEAGQRPFVRALLVPLPGRDIGPPEWNLRGATGVYTVQMATYYDVPEENYFGRKRSAVQLCKKFREMGCEGYYYHGPVRSHVTIGTFGAASIQTIQKGTSVKTVTQKIRDPKMHEIIRRFPQFNVNGNAHVIYVPIRVPGSRYGKRKRVVVEPFPVRIPGKKDEDVTAPNPGPGDRQSQQAQGNP